MNTVHTKKLTAAAMMAALCCVATMVIQIPSPMNGYVNLGDCFVLLSAFILGPAWGAAAAGIGSMMADVLSGYMHYAVATLVIKGAMAFAAAMIYSAGRTTLKAVLGGIVAEAIMVLGYFLFACILMGEGLAAALSIPGNVVQGIVGIIAGMLLLRAAEKMKISF